MIFHHLQWILEKQIGSQHIYYKPYDYSLQLHAALLLTILICPHSSTDKQFESLSPSEWNSLLDKIELSDASQLEVAAVVSAKMSQVSFSLSLFCLQTLFSAKSIYQAGLQVASFLESLMSVINHRQTLFSADIAQQTESKKFSYQSTVKVQFLNSIVVICRQTLLSADSILVAYNAFDIQQFVIIHRHTLFSANSIAG